MLMTDLQAEHHPLILQILNEVVEEGATGQPKTLHAVFGLIANAFESDQLLDIASTFTKLAVWAYDHPDYAAQIYIEANLEITD